MTTTDGFDLFCRSVSAVSNRFSSSGHVYVTAVNITVKFSADRCSLTSLIFSKIYIKYVCSFVSVPLSSQYCLTFYLFKAHKHTQTSLAQRTADLSLLTFPSLEIRKPLVLTVNHCFSTDCMVIIRLCYIPHYYVEVSYN